MSFWSPPADGAHGAFVLQPGEGRRIDLDGFAMTVKADALETAGALSLLEAEEPPGFGPPLHVHRNAAEAFVVLEGEYVILLPRGEVRCPAGAFVYIPAGVEHGFRVGGVPSRKLNLYVPSAMVGYFDELAAGADQDLPALAERYGMEVRGPVPEGYR